MTKSEFEKQQSDSRERVSAGLTSLFTSQRRTRRHSTCVKLIFGSLLLAVGAMIIWQTIPLYSGVDSYCWKYNQFILPTVKTVTRSSDINHFCLGPPGHKAKWVFHTDHAIFKKNLLALEKSVEKAIDFGCMRGWNFSYPIYLYMGPPAKKNPFINHDLSIWYQTEQNGSKLNLEPVFRESFHDATFIWDFSKFNVRRIEKEFGVVPAEKGGRAFYVPFWTALHEDFFSKRSVGTEWLYDVLLFGLMTKRRGDICEALKKLGARTCCGVFWGEDLVNRQRAARIILNVHVYPAGSLEVHRVNPVLASGMVVVSEETHDPDIDTIYKEAITMAPYDMLVAAVMKKVAQPEHELEKERRANVAWIRKRVEQVDAELCYALSRLGNNASDSVQRITT